MINTKLTLRQYAATIWSIMFTTFKAAPLAIVVQVVGSVINAVFPVVITYFAASTTTALASAYAGESGAGDRSVQLVIIT